jgi:hypothetical protein
LSLSCTIYLIGLALGLLERGTNKRQTKICGEGGIKVCTCDKFER